MRPGDQQGVRALPDDLRYGVGGHLTDARPGLARIVGKLLLSTRVQAVVLFRLAQAAHRISPALGSAVKYVNHVVTGADIAAQASIGPGLVLYHPTGVVIGPDCRLGSRCVVMQGVTLGHSDPRSGSGSPHLGDGVYVAPGAQVLGPVTVGAGAVIAANAVVLTDVPAGATAAGVPAVVRLPAGS